MRPYPEEVLRAIQSGIMSHFAPELTSTYAKAQFGFSMLLFSIAQRDYDTAVPDLVEANATLRALLSDAAAALGGIDRADVAAARDALAALPESAASLRLSALRAEHEGLRTAVCALAPLLEAASDDAALAPLQPSRAAIFAYLSADARKRIVPILSAG